VTFIAQRDAISRHAAPLPASPYVLVVSASRSAVFYDVRQAITRTADPKNELASRTPEELWQAAAGESSAAAYAALIELQRRDKLNAVAGDRIQEATASRDKTAEARKLISQLDDADTKVRESAHRSLERLGKSVATELRLANADATGEKADRIAALLRIAGDEEAAPATDELRTTRLLEVISWTTIFPAAATAPAP
jgi:hypothetical protein